MARPAHFPWVSPYIMASHLDSAIDFYTKVFGFELKEKTPEHVELRYKDQILMFGQEPTPTDHAHSPITLYIYCENVDEFHKSAVESGAKSLGAPEDMLWGDRMCRLQCPEGYVWAFATNRVPCNKT